MSSANGRASGPGGFDLRRACQVITEGDAGAGWVGSGYWVTRDKVLTAAHVVCDAQSAQVRFLTEDGRTTELSGEPIWMDSVADIALLRIPRDTSIGGLRAAEVRPVRFGRVTEVVECEALGFPRFKLRTDSAPPDGDDAPKAFRDSHHARGSVEPWANLRQRRLEINVGPPEYDRERGRSPWEGISGAAVWSGGCVIGVISEHYPRDGLGRLAASRVDHWHQLLTAAQVEELNELIGLPTDAGRLERLPAPPPSPKSKATIALDYAAEQLAQAIRVQWTEEAGRQQLGVPELVVRWGPSRACLWDQWRNINPPEDEDDRPLNLAGHLREIVKVHEDVPSRRLVVLGPAGSGKSVLAMRFVLDMLGPPGTPVSVVPVIFSLGSWDPAKRLQDWLISQLQRAYPGLKRPGPGTQTLAQALVDNGRILPVLDGFDEIADGLRPSALERLKDTAASWPPMPLLLTSRPAEYAAAVEKSGVLKLAAGIELTHLSLDDLEKYLPFTTRRTHADSKGTDADAVSVWDPVMKRLRESSGDPAAAQLATVLSTPLMAALARTVYGDPSGRDPSELLDTGKFSTPEALEDDLLGNFIAAAYRNKPDHDPERTQDWLGHLAEHLNQLGTHDLRWWQLGSTLGRPVRTLVVGLVVGLAFGFANTLASWLLDPGSVWRWLGYAHRAIFTLVSGLAFGLAYGLVDRGAAREPSRVRLRILSRTRKQRKTFVPRLVAGFVGGFAFGFVTLIVNALAYGLQTGMAPVSTRLPNLGRQPSLLDGLIVGLASGLALGLAYAGRASEPSRVRLRIADEMREFRERLVPRLAIGYAGGFGVGFGLVLVASAVIGFVEGFEGGFMALSVDVLKSGLEYGRVCGLAGGLAYGLIVALEEPIPISSAVSPSDLLKINRRTVVSYWLVCGLTCGLVGWIFFGLDGMLAEWLGFAFVGGLGGGLAYGLSLTAWGHWVAFSRIWLPLTGRLPWNVSAFLEDAHRRGVLRQVGTVYQFRHARLRDHLAESFRNPR